MSNKYDLEERTRIFGENIISFCRSIKQDVVTRPLINQLVKSGTSIGANYCEADEASSKKDFTNKMYIAIKEIKETKYWLKIISNSFPDTKDMAEVLWKECHELNLIFSTIIKKAKI